MEPLTELPYGLPGKVYRSPMPYSRFYDPDWRVLPAYRKAGVQAVVVLTSWDEVIQKAGVDLRQVYAEAGMDVIHLPTPDFGTPAVSATRVALDQALQAARGGQNLAIHCHAGLGRTGIFAACLARLVFNWDGRKAFAWVRQSIPGAVENQEQLAFIEAFQV
jgi:protein-tyrosine phosphatase